MNDVNEQGNLTRARRFPCRGGWKYGGCGEVIRMDEAFAHLVEHHPDAGPQALVLAALAGQATTAGVWSGNRFYEWVIAVKDSEDWTSGTCRVLNALVDIADDRDPTAEALTACTDTDRAQLVLLFEIKQKQYPDESVWPALIHIVNRDPAATLRSTHDLSTPGGPQDAA